MLLASEPLMHVRGGPSDTVDIDPCEDIVRSLAKSLDVSGSILTMHFDGDADGRTLSRSGVTDDDVLAAMVVTHAQAIVDNGPSPGDQAVDRAWMGRIGPAGRPLLSIIFRNIETRSKVVFSAVFDRNGPPDRKILAATLRRLLPMLDPYFLLWQRSRHAAQQNRALRGALDRVDFGVVLVDRDGAPCFANAVASLLLANGRFVRQRGTGIHAGNLRDTMRLQAAIGSAIAGNAGEHPECVGGARDSAQLKLVHGDDHIIVAVLPAERRADEPGAAAAMLVLLKPDDDPERIATPVCRIFGLSGVETRLACQLVTGRSLAEACEVLRIRETTGRGYLKQIFAKCNVNRQAELVRVLLSGIIHARSGGLIQII